MNEKKNENDDESNTNPIQKQNYTQNAESDKLRIR